MRFGTQNALLTGLAIFGLLLSTEAVGMQKRRALARAKVPKFEKVAHCGPKCQKARKLNDFMTEVTESATESLVMPTTLEPFRDESDTTDGELSVPNTTTPIPIPSSTEPSPGFVQFEDLAKVLRAKRKDCKGLKDPKSLTCQKLKLSSWFLQQLGKNYTEVMSSYVRLTRNSNLTHLTRESELMPENWPEKIIFRIISKFGEPVDKLLFYQYKKYTKSRELSVEIPHLLQVKVSPRTHAEAGTGRTLFDPGFNLKLKLPFFRDELKVAVSTGPSFLAGLGVGLVVLGIKSIFAPLVLGLKYVILSMFLKDMSPLDLVKSLTSPLLPSWMSPGPEENLHHPSWEQSVEHYEPPQVHNVHDNYGPTSYDKKGSGYLGNLGTLLSTMNGLRGPSSFDQSNMYSQPNPIFQQNLAKRPPPRPSFYRPNSWTGDGEGRTQAPRPLDEGAGQDEEPPYVPSAALQLEVQNFDPFYSPLLSRIDSIFMHLGFTEEGCKERAVCSIYKFPVKYAPYSNLLSAQLSKHQSELKRPVTTSPKILRYFKYMKAAKDGQAALNCIELYPKCTNDTEKLSNLPMVKTFQQLTELMGTGSG